MKTRAVVPPRERTPHVPACSAAGLRCDGVAGDLVGMAVPSSNEVIREDASAKNALLGAAQGDSHATCCDRSWREGIPSLCEGFGRPDLARGQDRHASSAAIPTAPTAEPGDP